MGVIRHMNTLQEITPAILGIIDYGKINKELVVPASGGATTLGNIFEKGKIDNIRDLRKMLSAIVSNISNSIIDSGTYVGKIEINDHFISQLVFDILYDKYIGESPMLTLATYCKKYVSFEWDKKFNQEDDGYSKALHATLMMMSTQLKYEHETKQHASLRAESEMYGIAPSKYDDHLLILKELNEERSTDKKKSKAVWDYVYYNGNSKLITYKQFRRGFQVGKHYRPDDFALGYEVYDGFVKKFMIALSDSCKSKFIKTMDFYHLEIYKRLDFIYKLAVRMQKEGLTNIPKAHPFVKRFHPQVQYLQDNKGNIDSKAIVKYYRPFLFVEDVCPESKIALAEQTEGLLSIHYIIRSKAYEWFKYKFKFVSEDYVDMWEFINNHYNVLSYHDPKKQWFTTDRTKKREQVRRIKNAVDINKTLFGESEAKKTPSRQSRPNQCKKTE